MKSRETFLINSYEKLKKAINNISNENAKEIYALSFYFYAEEDDSRFPTIEVSYNTIEQFKNAIKKASSETEAKWNYAFWLQEGIEKIGGEDDELLKKWFDETPYYFSEDDIEKSEDDDDLFDELLEQGEKFETEFVEGIIILIQFLFEDDIISRKFGKPIPVLIHELEYYDTPIGWIQKANKPEVIEEFIKAFKGGKI